MDYACKISIIGNQHTGKTSLINRYINNIFSDEYKTTLGADFIDKTYGNKEIPDLTKNDVFNVTFWDMAGQQHYIDVASLYLEGSMGIMIVYDVNNAVSFKDIQKWKGLSDKICPDASLLIVGNKADLEVKVDTVAVKELEKSLGSPIEFVSAKTNENVENIFQKIVTRVLKQNLNKK